MMEDALHDATEELKRADHLLYVSLKYTRTVDVIKSLLERIIAGFQCVIDGLLQKARKEEKIDDVPSAPKRKIEKLLELYPEQEMVDYIEFFVLLRKLSKAKYTARQEYRRHVTMEAVLEDQEIYEVDIDKSHEFYDTAKKFIEYVRENYGGE